MSTPGTAFLSAERAATATYERQVGTLLRSERLAEILLDSASDMVLVLNRQRQVVFANRSFLDLVGLKSLSETPGNRPGEILGCIHSDANEGGCGCSEFCRTCGAAQAIAGALMDKPSIRECRISSNDGSALDLKVKSHPIVVTGESFIAFVLTDISHEKRRRVLERVFFHDVMNTITGLKLQLSVSKLSGKNPEEVLRSMEKTIEGLTEEIQSQRTLVAAENDELALKVDLVSGKEVVNDLVNDLTGLASGRRCRFEVDPSTPDAVLETDAALLRRVVRNMLTNAIEASHSGAVIGVSVRVQGKKKEQRRVVFSVSNPGYISRDVQMQIFQRSFSTKGDGRGLGTYSMQLFTRRILKGEVWFETSPDAGTTFHAAYPVVFPRQ